MISLTGKSPVCVNLCKKRVKKDKKRIVFFMDMDYDTRETEDCIKTHFDKIHWNLGFNMIKEKYEENENEKIFVWGFGCFDSSLCDVM